MTRPLFVVVLALGWEKALRSLVLASQSNTGPRLMHVTVSSDDSKAASSIDIASAMRAIHRRPLNVEWLRPPLLMRVAGFGRRQRCHLIWFRARMMLIMNNNFLAAAALI